MVANSQDDVHIGKSGAILDGWHRHVSHAPFDYCSLVALSGWYLMPSQYPQDGNLKRSQSKISPLFSVVGCVDPAAVEGLAFSRQGNNAGTWSCMDVPITWTVQCQGSSWVGEPRDCTVRETPPSKYLYQSCPAMYHNICFSRATCHATPHTKHKEFRLVFNISCRFLDCLIKICRTCTW